MSNPCRTNVVGFSRLKMFFDLKCLCLWRAGASNLSDQGFTCLVYSIFAACATLVVPSQTLTHVWSSSFEDGSPSSVGRDPPGSGGRSFHSCHSDNVKVACE